MNIFVSKRIVLIAAFIVSSLVVHGAYAKPKTQLLPEHFKEVQTGVQTVTVYLEEDNPKDLAQKATRLHEQYAREGWLLFKITPFVDGEDTEGLLLTYRKKSQAIK